MITKYDGYCLICGKPRTDIHHLCFGNSKRPLADQDGLTIPLCRTCHEKMHNQKELQAASHIIGQLFYERNMCIAGMDADGARESFRDRYGVSYL